MTRQSTKKEQIVRVVFCLLILIIFYLLDKSMGAWDLPLYLKNPILVSGGLLIGHFARLVFFPRVDIVALFDKAKNGDLGDKQLAGLTLLAICILMGAIVLAIK